MRHLIRSAALAAVLVLAACGGASAGIADDSDAPEPLESSESTVIVGEVNWKSTTLLTAGTTAAKNANAVGYLSIPASGSRCTAWLVSKSMVVTNNHCIGSAAEAVGARVSFNYLDGVYSWNRKWYDCSTFVKTWADRDMTVLACKPSDGKYPGEVQGWLQLSDNGPRPTETVYVIHQNCDWFRSPSCSPTKKYSPGKVGWTILLKDFAYSADTLGGSSGSPVFDASSGKVVGLHHQGIGDSDDDGRGTRNEGVRVSFVRDALSQITLR